MVRLFCLLALSASFVHFGCGSATRSAEGFRVDPQRARQFGNTSPFEVDVEVLDTGAEPRRELRYRPEVGGVAEARLQVLVTTAEDEQTAERAFVFRTTVESAHEAGSTVVYQLACDEDGALVDDVGGLDDPNRRPLVMRVGYDDRGRFSRKADFEGDASMVLLHRGSLMLLLTAPYLPREPVGVGAIWRIATPASTPQPIRSNKVVEVRLSSMADSELVLSATTRVDTPTQSLGAFEMPATSARLEKRLEVDLADGMPLVPFAFESEERRSGGSSGRAKVSARVSRLRMGRLDRRMEDDGVLELEGGE